MDDESVPVQVRLEVPWLWGLSSVGRAPALHAGGQGFEPPRLHQIYSNICPPSKNDYKSINLGLEW